MSVVQRCPNCGTTQATAGECEACHEAQVRYFCTNHEPGLWVDARTCPTCGARFGDPERRPSVAPAPEPASALPVRRRPAAPAPEPAPTSAPPPPYARPGAGRERLRPVDERALDPSAVRGLLWQQLLRAAALARSTRRPVAAPVRERAPTRLIGGCLMRFLLFVMVLIVAILGALYLFGGALLSS